MDSVAAVVAATLVVTWETVGDPMGAALLVASKEVVGELAVSVERAVVSSEEVAMVV